MSEKEGNKTQRVKKKITVRIVEQGNEEESGSKERKGDREGRKNRRDNVAGGFI